MEPKSRPLLSVRNLKTYFFTDEGVVKAVDDASFDINQGRTLGIVGESGCGKSVAARSILRIVEQPGRILDGQIILHGSGHSGISGEVDLVTLPADSPKMRSIRGLEIALIFQEPMSSLSPVHTIGNQLIEAILLHQNVNRREARLRAIDILHQVGIPRPAERLEAYSFQLSGGLRQRFVM